MCKYNGVSSWEAIRGDCAHRARINLRPRQISAKLKCLTCKPARAGLLPAHNIATLTGGFFVYNGTMTKKELEQKVNEIEQRLRVLELAALQYKPVPANPFTQYGFPPITWPPVVT